MATVNLNDYVTSLTSPYVCVIAHINNSESFDLKVVGVKQNWSGDVDFFVIGTIWKDEKVKNYSLCDISGKIKDIDIKAFVRVDYKEYPSPIAKDVFTSSTKQSKGLYEIPKKYPPPQSYSEKVKIEEAPKNLYPGVNYTVGDCTYYHDIMTDEYVGEKVKLSHYISYSESDYCWVISCIASDGEELVMLETELLECLNNKCKNSYQKIQTNISNKKQTATLTVFDTSPTANTIPQLDFKTDSFDLKIPKKILPKLNF